MQHRLSSSKLNITVNSLGAELSSVRNIAGLEYLWQAGKEVWPRHAPVLFPIVGRLSNNSYTVDGAAYSMGQHGFARDLEFELIEGSSGHCLFELRSDAGTRQAFPFEFVFRIAYRLEEDRLSCSYQVSNPSAGRLLFSVGAHPGFNCPLLPGEAFEDYYLEFERHDLYCTQLDNGLRTGRKQRLLLESKRLQLSPALFDQDALVFENGQIDRVSLCSARTAHKITIDCAGWPYFGIWAKKGTSRFVCLEPWYGIADHVETNGRLAQKTGILQLAPGHDFNCSFSVAIA